ncbi:MAG: hypothetical protein ABH885_05525, partial [Candidatus Omnitrophota bacterium]
MKGGVKIRLVSVEIDLGGGVKMADEILVVINPDFDADHAGRGRRAVYARDEAKVMHEITELKRWMEFALKEGIVTGSGIKAGKLGIEIIRWTNAGDPDRLRRAAFLKKRFHHEACQEEFLCIVKERVRSGSLSIGVADRILKGLSPEAITVMVTKNTHHEFIDRHMQSSVRQIRHAAAGTVEEGPNYARGLYNLTDEERAGLVTRLREKHQEMF